MSRNSVSMNALSSMWPDNWRNIFELSSNVELKVLCHFICFGLVKNLHFTKHKQTICFNQLEKNKPKNVCSSEKKVAMVEDRKKSCHHVSQNRNG